MTFKENRDSMNKCVQFVGPSVGQQGPHSFFRAFRFCEPEQLADEILSGKKVIGSKSKLIAIGHFFFVRISANEDPCIGELQLLWYDTQSNQSLSSVRLYFLPEQTPEGRRAHHGEHEVLAASEKVVLRLEDLGQWITDQVDWNHGLFAPSCPPRSPPKAPPAPRAPSSAHFVSTGRLPRDLSSSSPPPLRELPISLKVEASIKEEPELNKEGHVIRLLSAEVKEVKIETVSLCSTADDRLNVKIEKDEDEEKVEKEEVQDEEEEEEEEEREIEEMKTTTTSVVILSYPHYCRYRSILLRLGHLKEKWLRDSLVEALGGFSAPTSNSRALFCRETFDHEGLMQNEMNCEHLTPNLKARINNKKTKQMKVVGRTCQSPNSESNSSVEDCKENGAPLPKIEGNEGAVGGPAGGVVVVVGGAVQEKKKFCKDEQEFLQKLFKFMQDRNTPINRVPHLGFKQIDLYFFYMYAQRLGGYANVTGKKMWKHVYDEMGGNPGSTSAATCTRRHYERLLLTFENHMNGEDHKNANLPKGGSSAYYKEDEAMSGDEKLGDECESVDDGTSFCERDSPDIEKETGGQHHHHRHHHRHPIVLLQERTGTPPQDLEMIAEDGRGGADQDGEPLDQEQMQSWKTRDDERKDDDEEEEEEEQVEEDSDAEVNVPLAHLAHQLPKAINLNNSNCHRSPLANEREIKIEENNLISAKENDSQNTADALAKMILMQKKQRVRDNTFSEKERRWNEIRKKNAIARTFVRKGTNFPFHSIGGVKSHAVDPECVSLKKESQESSSSPHFHHHRLLNPAGGSYRPQMTLNPHHSVNQHHHHSHNHSHSHHNSHHRSHPYRLHQDFAASKTRHHSEFTSKNSQQVDFSSKTVPSQLDYKPKQVLHQTEFASKHQNPTESDSNRYHHSNVLSEVVVVGGVGGGGVEGGLKVYQDHQTDIRYSHYDDTSSNPLIIIQPSSSPHRDNSSSSSPPCPSRPSVIQHTVQIVDERPTSSPPNPPSTLPPSTHPLPAHMSSSKLTLNRSVQYQHQLSGNYKMAPTTTTSGGRAYEQYQNNNGRHSTLVSSKASLKAPDIYAKNDAQLLTHQNSRKPEFSPSSIRTSQYYYQPRQSQNLPDAKYVGKTPPETRLPQVMYESTSLIRRIEVPSRSGDRPQHGHSVYPASALAALPSNPVYSRCPSSSGATTGSYVWRPSECDPCETTTQVLDLSMKRKTDSPGHTRNGNHSLTQLGTHYTLPTTEEGECLDLSIRKPRATSVAAASCTTPGPIPTLVDLTDEARGIENVTPPSPIRNTPTSMAMLPLKSPLNSLSLLRGGTTSEKLLSCDSNRSPPSLVLFGETKSPYGTLDVDVLLQPKSVAYRSSEFSPRVLVNGPTHGGQPFLPTSFSPSGSSPIQQSHHQAPGGGGGGGHYPHSGLSRVAVATDSSESGLPTSLAAYSEMVERGILNGQIPYTLANHLYPFLYKDSHAYPSYGK